MGTSRQVLGNSSNLAINIQLIIEYTDCFRSKIERADLQIHKWERMVKAHEENLPEAVPHCQAMLKEARDHRNSLENDPASHVVEYDSSPDFLCQANMF